MENFREEFLTETASTLKEIQSKFGNLPDYDVFSKELAHKLHTLKGSSLTFNLKIPGRFIHEIENLLQAQREKKITHTEWIKEVLDESLVVLSELFRQAAVNEELVFPYEISAKINYLVKAEKTDTEISLPTDFPADLHTQLSISELHNIQSGLLSGDNIFLLEVAFVQEVFAAEFKEIRRLLEEKCEIIGTFIVNTFASNKINFRILLTTEIAPEELLVITASAEGKVIYEYLNEKSEVIDSKNNFTNIVAGTIFNGKQTARKLGKTIDFEVSMLPIELPEKLLQVISIAFLHLIRNAVDHGIESREERLNSQKSPNGHISIEASIGKNIFRAVIKDDGRGIDTEKVFKKAVQNEFIKPDIKLSEEELCELIYQPNFTTSEAVSEISGRGIGLDAVKTAIKEVNGEIRVQSVSGRGTEFEIYLPIS